MNINEEAIEELVKLKIKAHFENDNKRYIISKEELIQFCIKLVQTIENCK